MTADAHALHFEIAYYWEIIHATKEQLQSFGIGAGMAFPGEGRAPRQLMTIDPRGYRTRIERDGGRFKAQISYPRSATKVPDFTSPPVAGFESSTTNGAYYDEYTGSAAAIVAAGLARMDQMPGQPGAARVSVSILPDGTIPTNTRDRRLDDGGARKITRKGKSAYRVLVRTGDAEQKRRQLVNEVARHRREREEREMPPPAVLLAMHRELKRLASVPPATADESTLHNGFWLRPAGAA